MLIKLKFMLSAAEAMVLSSSSEEPSPEIGGDDLGGDAGSHVATEANAIPVGNPVAATEASKMGANTCAWLPERVSLALTASADFAEFKKKRIFTFVHFFSGKEDVLSSAISRLAGLDGISVKCYSLDLENDPPADFLKEQPYGDLLDSCRNGEVDAGHGGPPCGSFSMVRHRPGGPPPVRNLEWIYGLPSNSVQQQDEADRGSVLAIRTTQMLGEIIQSQRRRKVPEAATLENPPGSESQTEGSMWALPETADFMERFDCAKAWFNTCAYQQKERVRWWKPAQFGGRLNGLESLRRKCSCPRDFQHEPLLGKKKTSEAAKYDLALEYARLVIQVFRTTLNLEWWRHLEKARRTELTQLQKSWIKSKEKHTGPVIADEVMRRMRNNKRSFGAEDVMKDHLPQQNVENKKARKEFQNQYFIAGMRNPGISVKRLGVLREAGQDILRLWNTFLKDHPGALEAARNYGTDRCQLNDLVANEWSLQLGRLLKVEPSTAVKLKGMYGFESPLNAPMWKAWQKFAKDPDEHIHEWAVTGAPLGMNMEIPSSGGHLPAGGGRERASSSGTGVGSSIGNGQLQVHAG